MRSSRSLLLLAALAGVGLLAGCADERPPVNRLQPDRLPKKFFVGEKLMDPTDDPEFWYQGTLIDVGYGAAQDGLFTSTYGQPISRVKFVIQENLLVARLTYERIDASDGKGAGAASTDGVIVAAYPITSHFDVKREYNPATGEELNVVGENNYDRPWYEREFMRVDFSTNLNVDSYDFDTLSQTGIYGGVTYEPLSYYINDPTDENAPHFAEADHYFDVTTKAFAKPGMIDLRKFGWGIDFFPSCWLDPDFMGGTGPAASCNPVELTVRHSFRKVVDNDYEPEHWDGVKFQAYGAFTADRKGYARNYGMTDDRWYRFIARYNVWERSHFYTDPANMTGPVECYTKATPVGADPNRDENNDGTADECVAAGPGSQCDTFKQKCTLPYRSRNAKPVIWHYTAGSNLEYFEGTEWAAHEWDIALRTAVVTAKYAECMRVGGAGCESNYPVLTGQADQIQDAVQLAWEVDLCRNGKAYAGQPCEALADRLASERQYASQVAWLAKQPEMVVLCHSPVEAGDPAACGTQRLAADFQFEGQTGAAGCAAARKARNVEKMEECDRALTVRIGDLRYHQVNVIQIPQTPSPWGIMVDSVDPLTGEKVAASINVWSHVSDLWAQSVVDQARYIAGEIPVEQLTEGKYIYDWSRAAESATFEGAVPAFHQHDVDTRLSSYVNKDVRALPRNGKGGIAIDPVQKAKALEIRSKVAKDMAFTAKASTFMRSKYEARRKHALNSAVEAELTTPMMQQYAGVDGAAVGQDTILQLASPLRGANPQMARELRQRKELALAARGACMLNEAPAPLAIADFSKVLQQKFGDFEPGGTDKTRMFDRAEKMRRFIAQRAHYSVIAHEMGHSVGLRHNFVSSSDAFNYRPQYWQLRTRNGTAQPMDITDPGNSPLCQGLQAKDVGDATDRANGMAGSRDCVGPRYYDPVTQEEKDNLIPMWMHSSIMEYPGETTQDMMGLGIWDFGAAQMFYGNAVQVYRDPSYAMNAEVTGPFGTRSVRAIGVLDKMDGFGGILGFKYVIGDRGGTATNPSYSKRDLHYSQLQSEFELIKNCRPVDPNVFKPASWNAAKYGEWSPLLDGLLVQVDGVYKRCDTQPVDYVQWNSLKYLTAEQNYGTPKGIDQLGRVRVPHGFATDTWADLGNLAVYRHDNGADGYELFDFLITQQEVMHIFSNYRRNMQTFSVRGASSRALERYNEKMRDGAKGLGLMANVYREALAASGEDFDDMWATYAALFFRDNILASSVAFDYFTRQLQRPQHGETAVVFGDKVVRSNLDAYYNTDPSPWQSAKLSVNIPNGASGMFQNVAMNGRPMENALCEDPSCGEYRTDYTMNAGSYYDKAWAAMLMTESVDNFISASRGDFYDGRYRSVAMADLFPEPYRRWLANNLTGDDEVKGTFIEAVADPARPGNLMPKPGDQNTPSAGIGWTTWLPRSGPQVCFPSSITNRVFLPEDPNYQIDISSCVTTMPANVLPLDPQVGWEQQKFLIAFTMQYLPENQQQWWLDQLHIWEMGVDADPQLGTNRIELHNPRGKTYVARTMGREDIFGKRVQKGISARVLEWANQLLVKAYDTTPVDVDSDGVTDWYLPRMTNGQPRVLFDPAMGTRAGCSASDNSGCTCSSNKACMAFERYMEVPYFMRESMEAYGLADPSFRGIYD